MYNQNYMSTQADNLQNALLTFGLSEEESQVYLFLLKNGRSSALYIHKSLKIPRTKVYRLLNKLGDKGLVVEEVKGYGTKFVAESYEKLNEIIWGKEAELYSLKHEAPNLFNQLAQLTVADPKEYKILHYRGVEGLKQVTWNSTKAKDLFRIYEINNMHAFLDFEFSEKVRMKFLESKIKTHQLTNQKELDDYTEIPEVVEYMDYRYISPEELEIIFEIAIYNDTLVMYSYEKHDIFCVELINPKLAKMQKQIFDLIWKDAKRMKKIGANGQAKI